LGEWSRLAGMMVDAAQTLEKAGAEFIVICANTMHARASSLMIFAGVPRYP
jgi:aspartate racemase